MELFTLQAVWAVLAIILIDIVLAGDNALVIGMAANKLTPDLRKKAIFWGTFAAIAIRFVSVLFLTYLLMIPGLRLIGAIALVWIAWKLVSTSEHKEVAAQTTFWSAISTIVIADAVMGIDNALAIAAAANGNFLFVIFGLLLSIPIILFGSTIIANILKKYPNAIYIGSFVLFVVAMQMMMKEKLLADWWAGMNDFYEKLLPWVIGLILVAKQYYRTQIRKNNERTA